MNYLCYIVKDDPEILIKLEYEGDQDIKLIAALTFLIKKWWMDASLSLILDAIEGTIEYKKIYDIFDEHCTVVNDVFNTLNKKVVTAADLFS